MATAEPRKNAREQEAVQIDAAGQVRGDHGRHGQDGQGLERHAERGQHEAPGEQPLGPGHGSAPRPGTARRGQGAVGSRSVVMRSSTATGPGSTGLPGIAVRKSTRLRPGVRRRWHPGRACRCTRCSTRRWSHPGWRAASPGPRRAPGTRANVASRPSCGSAAISAIARSVAPTNARSASRLAASVASPTTRPGPGQRHDVVDAQDGHLVALERDLDRLVVGEAGRRVHLVGEHRDALAEVREQRDGHVVRASGRRSRAAPGA